jgi:hypothetical protein
MGAWFVLSALGLFSTTPGTPDYVLTSPLFKHVVLHRSDQPHFLDTSKGAAGFSSLLTERAEDDFHIIARNAAPLNVHSTKILFNGQLHTSPLLSDESIRGGGVLQFFLESAETSAESGHEPVEDLEEVSIKAARDAQQRHGQSAGSTAEEKGLAKSQREDLQKEIDKQKRLIASLTNELAGPPPSPPSLSLPPLPPSPLTFPPSLN